VTKIFDIVPGWLYAIALALLGVLVLGQRGQVSNAQANVDQSQKELSDWKLSAAEARILADRAQQLERDRREAVVKGALDAAHSETAVAQASATVADRSRDSMRSALSTYVAAVHARADPGLAGRSANLQGGDPLDLLAGLLNGGGEALGQLGKYAGRLRIAGLACERISDGLQPQAAPK
jgi:hypothetical protein